MPDEPRVIPGLVLAFERSGTQVVVHLVGDLDMASAPYLVGEVLTAWEGATEVVLDVSALHFTGAAGAHALMVIARRLADAGCETIIRRPSDRLLFIIDLTDLRTIVDLRDVDDTTVVGSDDHQRTHSSAPVEGHFGRAQLNRRESGPSGRRTPLR